MVVLIVDVRNAALCVKMKVVAVKVNERTLIDGEGAGPSTAKRAKHGFEAYHELFFRTSMICH